MFQNVIILFMSDITGKVENASYANGVFKYSVECTSKKNSVQCFFRSEFFFFSILNIKSILILILYVPGI